MPKRVNKIPSVGHKKRKVSVAANNESGPPKKRVYKLCSAEGCASKAQKGGVCIKHGAKKEAKTCSVDGCTNIVQKRGVCMRHGAQKKLCSVDDCTKYAQKRGVCIRHGAMHKRCSVDDCTNQARKGRVCIRHGAKVERKLCSVGNCKSQARRRGLCTIHGAYLVIAPRAQGIFLCGEVQGGGNQNDVSTVVAISDNEGEGGKKQSPIADRKRKADNVGKKSETAASDDTEEDGLVRERSKEPTRRSTRLSTLSKPNYNEDVAYTEMEGNADGNEEEEEATDHAPSEDNEMVQLDQKRGQPETACEGRPVTALERDVLSEEDQGQDAHAGSTKRLRINSSEDNLIAVKDNETSAIAPGVDHKVRSREDPVDGHEVETEQCNDRWDGANQDKDDDEEVETQDTMVLSERDSGEIDMPKQAGNNDGDESNEMLSEIDHQERLLVDPADANEVETEQDQDDDTWDVADQQAVYSPAEDDEESGTQQETPLSQRDSGEIDVPKQVELHQSNVPESEQMVSESKDEQLQQTEERCSALGKAAKLRETTESKLRSDLAEQVKITANLQAQLDQAAVENRRLQEQRVHDSDVWDEERKQMKNEYALVVHQKEVELKTRKTKIESELQMKAAELQEMTSKASHAESRAKSVEEELARSATQVQAQRDEISRLNSENEDMKGRHEDALAKEVAEKNRLQAELESLRAQKGSSSEAKGTSPASSISQTDIATFARSYETRSQSRQRQSGRGSIATDQTYPKRRTSPRGGNKSDSNMKSRLETISEGGGASIGESTRKKTAEPKNRTATRSQRGEKLPHGLDKELVQKINDEIVESGQEVTFDDIAGLEDAKNTVDELVILPMQRPDLFTGLRTCPKGLLLFGPPGTGKTMIGKAIAHESSATFFSISSSSLTSKWIGEGEKLVKTLFAVASYRSPSVVFIDEIDSMLTQRKAEEDDASRRMKTEFLVQLDGAGNERKGHVLVIGATNLPHELDDAARRRFAKRLYIPLPDQSGREKLLRTLLAKNNHSLKDNEIIKLSHATDGYSGADLKNLCTDASMGPMRSLTVEERMSINIDDVPPISCKHFRRSLKGMNPSVAQSDLQVYLDWNDKYGSKVTKDLDNDDDDDDCDSSDDENE